MCGVASTRGNYVFVFSAFFFSFKALIVRGNVEICVSVSAALTAVCVGGG